MRPLLLVRHGRTSQIPGVLPPHWPLAPDAKDEIARLRGALAIGSALTVAASDELKAISTAEILVAPGGTVRVLGAFAEVAKPWYDDPADHQRAARRYLAGEELEGWEPLADAVERFDAGVASVGAAGSLIVTHGTVMTAWLGSVLLLDDPGGFWSELGMPDAYSVDLRAGRLERVSVDATG